jgi:hypothetical protein
MNILICMHDFVEKHIPIICLGLAEHHTPDLCVLRVNITTKVEIMAVPWLRLLVTSSYLEGIE